MTAKASSRFVIVSPKCAATRAAREIRGKISEVTGFSDWLKATERRAKNTLERS